MSDKLSEIVLNSKPPRRLPTEAFVVANGNTAARLQKQLRDKGVADDYYVVSVGQHVAGYRFSRVFIQGDITREMTAREFENFDRWINESIRTRLLKDGQIIILP